MVRRLTASCPKNCRKTAPSVLLRLQQLCWLWIMAPVKHCFHSTRTQCPACRQLRLTIWKISSFAISWTSSRHWATKVRCVRFCWVSGHCGIEGDEKVDHLTKEILDHGIGPLTTVHYADLKPLVNSYIHQEVHIKLDVSIHGRHLCFVKLRIGHTKPTKSRYLPRGRAIDNLPVLWLDSDHRTHAPEVHSVTTKSW